MGNKTPPKATMVTPLAPVSAVNKAQLQSAAIAIPPGSHPNNACIKFMIRSGAFVEDNKHPTKVKSGSAIKTGIEASRFISITINCNASGSYSTKYKQTIDSAAITVNSGASISAKIRTIKMSRTVIFITLQLSDYSSTE
jgi:hypothetical protein